MANEICIKRLAAAALIGDIQEIVSERVKMWNDESIPAGTKRVKDTAFLDRIQRRLRDDDIPLLGECPGHAHSPEVAGNQDHCSICAPRWGWVGPKVVIR